uniref:Uncharacterized protein n=1 Tax=Solanum lycopersicum TaxID=4081 RepID=A0A494G8I4_SOLLC
MAYHHRHWVAHTFGSQRALDAIITLGQHTRSNYIMRGMPLSIMVVSFMPTWPFGSRHGWMRSGMACHYRPSVAHTFGRRRALHDIIALRSIEGRTTLVLTCHHRPLDNLMVIRCRAWHDIMSFAQHIWSDYVRHEYMIGLRQPWQCYNRPWAPHIVEQRRELNVIIALVLYTWSVYIGCDILSSPLERIHDQTMLIMAYYNLPMTEHMIGQRRALHVNMALGKHTRSNYVGHSIPSFPLGSTRHQTMSDMTCHLCPWTANMVNGVGRVMPLSPFDNIHGQNTSGLAAHAVGRRKAWHSIITIGQHKRSNNVMFDMPSSTLDSTHGGKTLSVEYHNCLWIAYMVRLRRAWNANMALAANTRSDYARHGRHSSPLGSIHGKNTQFDDVGRYMLSSPFDITYDRKMSGVACPHVPSAADVVGWHPAWDAIITFGQRTWWDEIACYATSPLGRTRGRMISGVTCHLCPWTTHMVE